MPINLSRAEQIGDAEQIGEENKTILDRIDQKVQERKNG